MRGLVANIGAISGVWWLEMSSWWLGGMRDVWEGQGSGKEGYNITCESCILLLNYILFQALSLLSKYIIKIMSRLSFKAPSLAQKRHSTTPAGHIHDCPSYATYPNFPRNNETDYHHSFINLFYTYF